MRGRRKGTEKTTHGDDEKCERHKVGDIEAWNCKGETFEDIELKDVQKIDQTQIYRWPRNRKDHCK